MDFAPDQSKERGTRPVGSAGAESPEAVIISPDKSQEARSGAIDFVLNTPIVVGDRTLTSECRDLIDSYVLEWIRNPDPGSAFERATRFARKLPDKVLIGAMRVMGYNGLVFCAPEGVVGHVFFQRHKNELHLFSIGVASEYRGMGVAEKAVRQFVEYARNAKDVDKIRVGSGGHPATSKIVEKLRSEGLALGVVAEAGSFFSFADRSLEKQGFSFSQDRTFDHRLAIQLVRAVGWTGVCDQSLLDSWTRSTGIVSAWQRSRLIGLSSLTSKGDFASIRECVVDPAVQKSGIGSSLLRRAIQRAESLGATVVQIEAWLGNPTLPAYYARFGFQDTGDRTGNAVIMIRKSGESRSSFC